MITTTTNTHAIIFIISLLLAIEAPNNKFYCCCCYYYCPTTHINVAVRRGRALDLKYWMGWKRASERARYQCMIYMQCIKWMHFVTPIPFSILCPFLCVISLFSLRRSSARLFMRFTSKFLFCVCPSFSPVQTACRLYQILCKQRARHIFFVHCSFH